MRAFPQTYTISGFVRDVSSGEALIGANIYNMLEQDGTATNQYGFSVTPPRKTA